MIHVTVGMQHVREGLGRRGVSFNNELERALKPLYGKSYVDRHEDLHSLTVADIMCRFHHHLKASLFEHAPNVLKEWRNEIERLGSEIYHLNDFRVTDDDAANALALYQLFPHGTESAEPSAMRKPASPSGIHRPGMERVANDFGETNGAANVSFRQPIWMPDVAISGRCYAFFTELKNAGEQRGSLKIGVPDVANPLRFLSRFPIPHPPISKLEVHLCDNLRKVWDRTEHVYQQFAELAMNSDGAIKDLFVGENGFLPANKGPDRILAIDALLYGFVPLRLLRNEIADVPTVGEHRWLSGTALRMGIGKPSVSRIFPSELWQAFKEPVQHFVLQAGEAAAHRQFQIRFPNLPSKQDLLKLDDAVSTHRVGNPNQDLEPVKQVLNKLGLGRATTRQKGLIEEANSKKQSYIELIHDDRFRYLRRTVHDVQQALVSDDVELSLFLEQQLNLYPLHKRVLGLLEALIGKQLKSDWRAVGDRWRNAFHDSKGRGDPKHRHTSQIECRVEWNDNPNATLESEGGWLIHASKVAGAQCRLADLLDDIMKEITDYLGFNATDIRLAPPDPGAHAIALEMIEQPTDQSRRLLLYLGNIVITLRNFIEHSLDEPFDGGLLVKNDYWNTTRKIDGKDFDLHEWCQMKADNDHNTWRRAKDLKIALARGVPPPANELLLDNASLHRCLILIALVLHGAKSHLNIRYD